MLMELEGSEPATLIYILAGVQFSDAYNDLSESGKADLKSILRKVGVDL